MQQEPAYPAAKDDDEKNLKKKHKEKTHKHTHNICTRKEQV